MGQMYYTLYENQSAIVTTEHVENVCLVPNTVWVMSIATTISALASHPTMRDISLWGKNWMQIFDKNVNYQNTWLLYPKIEKKPVQSLANFDFWVITSYPFSFSLNQLRIIIFNLPLNTSNSQNINTLNLLKFNYVLGIGWWNL